MAHFAELDINSIVLRVIVVDNEALDFLEFPESEAYAMPLLYQWYGPGLIWKQTSYNGNFRGNFAGIGYTYYQEYDIFMPSKPYPSWVLDVPAAQWVAPVPKPSCKHYTWDENTLSWIYVPPPPSPGPGWTLDQCDNWIPPEEPIL